MTSKIIKKREFHNLNVSRENRWKICASASSKICTTLVKSSEIKVFAWRKAPEKCFKFLHIFGIQKPMYFFPFFILTLFFPGKNKILGSSKWNKKKLHWFLYFKNMVNFVAFLWISSFFKTRLFLKSEYNTFVWQKKKFPQNLKSKSFLHISFLLL